MPRTFLIRCDWWTLHPLISGVLRGLPNDAQVFIAISFLDKVLKEMDLSAGPKPTFLQERGTHEIFARTGQVDAVFYAGYTESWAKELIGVSIAHGIPQFVLASVNRSDSQEVTEELETPTGVLFVDSLIRIEDHLRRKAVGTQLIWTILQRAEAMEAMKPGMIGSSTIASLWAGIPPGTRVQLVSMSDVGWFGAQALLEPSKWKNKTIGIAGDELTFHEADSIYKGITGTGIETNFGFVGTGLKWFFPSIQNKIDWLVQIGHHIDIEACRAHHPELEDFATWVRRHADVR